MVLRRSFSLALLLAAASCAEGPGPSAPEVSFSVQAPGHLVAGSGHVAQGAGLREFTFHAVERPDGSVTGSYKIVLPNGLFFEADVTCMSVAGNTGWVSGRIRETNAGIVVVGSLSMFYAIDNGEGGETPDVVSLAALNMPEGTDIGFCEEQPLILPPLTVTDGNVGVR